MTALLKGSRYAAGLICTLYILIAAGCSSSVDNRDREIDVQLLEMSTEFPSKIKLFFRVDLDDSGVSIIHNPPEFEIYENRSQISSLESQATIKREAGDFMYSSILMLDLSGSILFHDDLSALKEAAKSFVEKAIPAAGESHYGTREMAIYWFDGSEDIHRLVFFTNERDTLISGIESIDETISDDVSTNLNGAVIQGLSVLNSRLENNRSDPELSTAGSMVLFTDGTDQAARESTEDALEAIYHTYREHALFTIGLGGEIDETVLTQFGKDGFEFARDTLELGGSFLAIADRLENVSNSYFVLEYCSPKRAGEHMLQLRAIFEDRYGSFEAPFSAEGFAGGCTID